MRPRRRADVTPIVNEERPLHDTTGARDTNNEQRREKDRWPRGTGQFGRVGAQLVGKQGQGMAVAFDALAGHRGKTGLAHEGDLAKVLARGHVGDVDLHARKAHGLERVKDGDARVRVGRRVHDDAVVDAQGLLDGVDDGALVIGLEVVARLKPQLTAGRLDEGAQGGVVLAAVDGGLANAEHVDVGTVDNECFHEKLLVYGARCASQACRCDARCQAESRRRARPRCRPTHGTGRLARHAGARGLWPG